jgi:hypothetical protein
MPVTYYSDISVLYNVWHVFSLKRERVLIEGNVSLDISGKYLHNSAFKLGKRTVISERKFPLKGEAISFFNVSGKSYKVTSYGF